MDNVNQVVADYKYYRDVFKGHKSEEEIDLDTASMEVYMATYCRAKKDKVTPFQCEMVKMAICAQADNNANTVDTATGAELPDNVESYSIGDVSIGFDTSKTTPAESATSQTGICKRARKYLLPTGLLNRCVGVV